ncbi:hypothetical protein COLO4_18783 [Corchorus olitorius]|uniref:F-box domain-containing protein n=1 Tax=Corchorus olitorius TaxID=93759 RepID=A0A1R3J7U5_9ROSI|nr:hypothetical protein COLO4_18783 [Corchorus olitorius]
MASRINLPNDIIMEILYRLAGEDLVRLRCVSKDCRDLIDSPDFVKLNLSHSLKTNSHRFLILPRRGRNSDKYCNYIIDFVSPETVQMIKSSDILNDLEVKFPIIGSCNGLIAFETNNSDGFVICNPTTKKIRKVPPPPRHIPELVNYGFGYDPVSDDYKLVMMFQPFGLLEENVYGGFLTYIYSLKVGCWESSFHETRYCTVFSQTSGILVNNALYWMLDGLSIDDARLVAFDLTSERYRDVPLPLLDDQHYYYSYMDIKELGGCLCMIGHGGDYVDIWVFKGESWTKLSSFTSHTSALQNPVAYSKCGQKVLLHIYSSTKNRFLMEKESELPLHKLVWCNLKREKIDKDMQILEFRDNYSNVDVCVSSLVSPMYGCSNQL